jgi:hypothetical protein
MAQEFKWKINEMQSAKSEDGLTDVVKNISWTYSLQEIVGNNNWYVEEVGNYGCGNPDPDNYTPYDELTFEQVTGWLEAGFDMPVLQERLITKLDNQKNPPLIYLPLPWQEIPINN